MLTLSDGAYYTSSQLKSKAQKINIDAIVLHSHTISQWNRHTNLKGKKTVIPKGIYFAIYPSRLGWKKCHCLTHRINLYSQVSREANMYKFCLSCSICVQFLVLGLIVVASNVPVLIPVCHACVIARNTICGIFGRVYHVYIDTHSQTYWKQTQLFNCTFMQKKLQKCFPILD